MLKVENVEVVGFEHAIRGMRNPKNSWDKSDSSFNQQLYWDEDEGMKVDDVIVNLGPNDYKLAATLAKGGPVHAKYRRMIVVYLDITAPLYWWKEFDTYKVGTVANSCSTMHKIHAKEFTAEDFSYEHLTNEIFPLTEEFNSTYMEALYDIITTLNAARDKFLETGDKQYWWQMIQLLPTSYNQKRTVMLSYEVLTNIYRWRKDHKLDEWHTFCDWIRTLPYSELITGDEVSE